MTTDPSQDERLRRRRQRLVEELADENVPILGSDNHPSAMDGLHDTIDELVIDELLYARYIPVHEGHRASYCALITARVPDAAESDVDIAPEATLDDVRAFVDGIRTALLRDSQGNARVVSVDVSDELRLLDAVRSLDAVAVQRLPDGRTVVTSKRAVATNDAHEWFVRPQARTVLMRVSDVAQITGTGEGLRERVSGLRNLLDMCLHRLSPSGIGATFVLQLDGTVADLSPGLQDEGDEPELRLNAFSVTQRDLLVNMLASVDGACLVSPDGTIERYKSKLNVDPEAVRLVSEHGGTRHTSAKRFSFSFPSTLVVVVSADGPVTIFSDGVSAATAREDVASVQPWRTRIAVSDQDHYSETRFQFTCETCSKIIEATVVTDDGHLGALPCHCPVCGTHHRDVDQAVELDTAVLKPWRARSL